MSHERTLDKYHSSTAFQVHGTPHIYLSFPARGGDNADITGISETREGRHIGTLERMTFACTQVTLINFSSQNIE